MSKVHALALAILALGGTAPASAQSALTPGELAQDTQIAEPALHAAARAGDRGRVESLLADGAKLEERDPFGRTALYVASRAGQREVVAELLRRGAQIDAPNTAGLTPLHIAAAQGHREVVGTLAANCAPIDARDTSRRTPLHMAAANGHLDVAQLLMASGADTLARRSQGTSVMQTAFAHHQDAVSEVLRTQALARAQARAALAAQTGTPVAEVEPVGDESEDLPAVSAAAPEQLRIPRDPAERMTFAQRQLGTLGYDPGPANGRSSPRTKESIEAFQTKIGQIVTGNVSQCLLEQLALAARAKSGASSN